MEDNNMSNSSLLTCDDCGVEESVSNEKVCTSCEQKVHCKSSVDDNSLCGEEDNYTSSNNTDSSDGNTKDEIVKFKAGDNFTMQRRWYPV